MTQTDVVSSRSSDLESGTRAFSFDPPRRPPRLRGAVLAAFAVLAALGTAGCATSAAGPGPTVPPVRDAEASYVAHVAFAGGGWRAHTGHSGWVLSLLDHDSLTLDSAFSNVGTISSNSGGSWFNAMLAFSPDFVQAIQAPGALATWDSTGWIGKQQHWFDIARADDGSLCTSAELFLPCVFHAYADEAYWDSIVDGLVFRDYPVAGTLSGSRQAWAQDKALLFAATMLTGEVVVNQDSATLDTRRYYQACLRPYLPVTDGFWGAHCMGDTLSVAAMPVTFASLPAGSALRMPPFLTSVSADTAPGGYDVVYTENVLDSPPVARAQLANPLSTDAVPVQRAAAASSAAVGFLASDAIVVEVQTDGANPPWELPYVARNEAPSFQLSGGRVQPVDASEWTLQQLADSSVVRLSDGGAVDNSAVAHLVSFLQLNGQADGFEIVAFDNVLAAYSPGGGAAAVGMDVANLFGEGLPQRNLYCADDRTHVLGYTLTAGICVPVPDLQIFDAAALADSTNVTWGAEAAPGDTAHALIYTRYEVTTVDNPALGVTAGTQGTLHVFTCVWSDADTAPENGSSDFAAYGEMLRFIATGLSQTGPDGVTGMEYLEDALGLGASAAPSGP